MSDYYAVVREGDDDHLEHLFGFGSKKGSQKANHRYIARVQVGNGWKYFYNTAELAAYKAGKTAKSAASGATKAVKGASKAAGSVASSAINRIKKVKLSSPIKVTTGEEARKLSEKRRAELAKRRRERERMYTSSNYETTTKKLGPIRIRVARKKKKK